METTPASKSENARVKNLTAAAILLLGLFLGSLFIDLTQLFTGSGFSGRVAKTHNVLEGRDKTWVAYDEPKVTLELVTEESCVTCSADEALIWIRRVVPTLEVREVEAASERGQALIGRFGINSIPALVFSESITQTDFYAQAESLFTENGNRYHFRMTELGLPAGKYLTPPSVAEGDITFGNPEARVTVIEYSDFQCPYCKEFHADLMAAINGKSADVRYVFKNMPLNIHPQSLNAALASECAQEQRAFAAYSDLLFERQAEWGNTTGTKIFKDYAFRTRLDAWQFTGCLDGQKYIEKLERIRAEADQFGVAGTPATFVNNAFLKGAVPREVIEETLGQALEN